MSLTGQQKKHLDWVARELRKTGGFLNGEFQDSLGVKDNTKTQSTP